MINEDLKIRLRDTFQLSERQVSMLEKLRAEIVEKAFNDTCKNKPRDRNYFKKALAYHQNPAKYLGELFHEPELKEKPTISREFLTHHREMIYSKFRR